MQQMILPNFGLLI